MIFDYYFAAGEKSKNILQKRMSKPYVDNFIEMHLFKISKFKITIYTQKKMAKFQNLKMFL